MKIDRSVLNNNANEEDMIGSYSKTSSLGMFHATPPSHCYYEQSSSIDCYWARKTWDILALADAQIGS
jgi:hypothetical protein